VFDRSVCIGKLDESKVEFYGKVGRHPLHWRLRLLPDGAALKVEDLDVRLHEEGSIRQQAAGGGAVELVALDTLPASVRHSGRCAGGEKPAQGEAECLRRFEADIRGQGPCVLDP
jgi:hypothetical protein